MPYQIIDALPSDPPFIPFPSRRSVVHSTNGIVACSQPLAAEAGIRILREGGNAADAAVAVAAALNVTEPASTGIGGDLFCLFYSSKSKKIHGLNASGRSPAALTLEKARSDLGLPPAAAAAADDDTKHTVDGSNISRIPMSHVHAVTVPGAAAGWCDVVEKFGSGVFGMDGILKDAIRLAEEGYPVSQCSALFWREGEEKLRRASPNFGEMLKNGTRAPREGEIMRLPNLARTFREVVEKGKKGFYEGRVADEIVKALKERGGVMTLEDLKEHGEIGSEEVDPVGLQLGDLKVWECMPNGQGIVALIALGILESLQEKGVIPALGGEGSYKHNSAEYLHVIIESLRIAFADGSWWIADPNVEKVPVEGLLNKSYLSNRSKLFNPEKANPQINHGSPAFRSSDTVYFSVTDKDGNGCSFINSNYAGFGSAIIPKTCGFTLQNRGSNFALQSNHPNRLSPRKRPYHTIIPAMITTHPTGDLHTVFGVMGGFMQPQGHVQVLLNMLAFGMSPQAALDAPRVSIGSNDNPCAFGVVLEEGLEGVEEGLKEKGHKVGVGKGWDRGRFGRGQVIRVHYDKEDEGGEGDERGRRIYSAGSDMRGDGHAVGY